MRAVPAHVAGQPGRRRRVVRFFVGHCSRHGKRFAGYEEDKKSLGCIHASATEFRRNGRRNQLISETSTGRMPSHDSGGYRVASHTRDPCDPQTLRASTVILSFLVLSSRTGCMRAHTRIYKHRIPSRTHQTYRPAFNYLNLNHQVLTRQLPASRKPSFVRP